MNTDKMFQSKLFKGFFLGLLGFLLLTFVFKVGEMVGVRKADFSCRWSDNYHKNFGGPKQGFMQGFGDKDFIEANGVVGQVIGISSTSSEQATLAIRGRGDIEKIVLINQDTIIKNLQETVSLESLQVNDMVIVIGQPNSQGQIEAKLIRVMPKPPTGMRFEATPKRILR